MKNLGRTIDRLIKVDPRFEEVLSQLKTKWKKYPAKEMNYWKEMFEYLNSLNIQNHPKVSEIKNIVTPKQRIHKRIYSFEDVTPQDIIHGAIPENITDLIKRHDRQAITLAKMRTEVSITRDPELTSIVARKEALQEINMKRIWIALKDYFNIWAKQSNFTIKKKGTLLVLTEMNPQVPPQFIGPGIVKMDADTLKRFMKFLGMDVPDDE